MRPRSPTPCSESAKVHRMAPVKKLRDAHSCRRIRIQYDALIVETSRLVLSNVNRCKVSNCQ